ncbi:hypothetical protein Ahia01_001204600 [Argonauta hians]
MFDSLTPSKQSDADYAKSKRKRCPPEKRPLDPFTSGLPQLRADPGNSQDCSYGKDSIPTFVEKVISETSLAKALAATINKKLYGDPKLDLVTGKSAETKQPEEKQQPVECDRLMSDILLTDFHMTKDDIDEVISQTNNDGIPVLDDLIKLFASISDECMSDDNSYQSIELQDSQALPREAPLRPRTSTLDSDNRVPQKPPSSLLQIMDELCPDDSSPQSPAHTASHPAFLEGKHHQQQQHQQQQQQQDQQHHQQQQHHQHQHQQQHQQQSGSLPPDKLPCNVSSPMTTTMSGVETMESSGTVAVRRKVALCGDTPLVEGGATKGSHIRKIMGQNDGDEADSVVGGASPVVGVASPAVGVASPVVGVASPVMGVASPAVGVASPAMGVASSRHSVSHPTTTTMPHSTNAGTQPSVGVIKYLQPSSSSSSPITNTTSLSPSSSTNPNHQPQPHHSNSSLKIKCPRKTATVARLTYTSASTTVAKETRNNSTTLTSQQTPVGPNPIPNLKTLQSQLTKSTTELTSMRSPLSATNQPVFRPPVPTTAPSINQPIVIFTPSPATGNCVQPMVQAVPGENPNCPPLAQTQNLSYPSNIQVVRLPPNASYCPPTMNVLPLVGQVPPAATGTTPGFSTISVSNPFTFTPVTLSSRVASGILNQPPALPPQLPATILTSVSSNQQQQLQQQPYRASFIPISSCLPGLSAAKLRARSRRRGRTVLQPALPCLRRGQPPLQPAPPSLSKGVPAPPCSSLQPASPCSSKSVPPPQSAPPCSSKSVPPPQSAPPCPKEGVPESGPGGPKTVSLMLPVITAQCVESRQRENENIVLVTSSDDSITIDMSSNSDHIGVKMKNPKTGQTRNYSLEAKDVAKQLSSVIGTPILTDYILTTVSKIQSLRSAKSPAAEPQFKRSRPAPCSSRPAALVPDVRRPESSRPTSNAEISSPCGKPDNNIGVNMCPATNTDRRSEAGLKKMSRINRDEEEEEEDVVDNDDVDDSDAGAEEDEEENAHTSATVASSLFDTTTTTTPTTTTSITITTTPLGRASSCSSSSSSSSRVVDTMTSPHSVSTAVSSGNFRLMSHDRAREERAMGGPRLKYFTKTILSGSGLGQLSSALNKMTPLSPDRTSTAAAATTAAAAVTAATARKILEDSQFPRKACLEAAVDPTIVSCADNDGRTTDDPSAANPLETGSSSGSGSGFVEEDEQVAIDILSSLRYNCIRSDESATAPVTMSAVTTMTPTTPRTTSAMAMLHQHHRSSFLHSTPTPPPPPPPQSTILPPTTTTPATPMPPRITTNTALSPAAVTTTIIATIITTTTNSPLAHSNHQQQQQQQHHQQHSNQQHHHHHQQQHHQQHSNQQQHHQQHHQQHSNQQHHHQQQHHQQHSNQQHHQQQHHQPLHSLYNTHNDNNNNNHHHNNHHNNHHHQQISNLRVNTMEQTRVQSSGGNTSNYNSAALSFCNVLGLVQRPAMSAGSGSLQQAASCTFSTTQPPASSTSLSSSLLLLSPASTSMKPPTATAISANSLTRTAVTATTVTTTATIAITTDDTINSTATTATTATTIAITTDDTIKSSIAATSTTTATTTATSTTIASTAATATTPTAGRRKQRAKRSSIKKNINNNNNTNSGSGGGSGLGGSSSSGISSSRRGGGGTKKTRGTKRKLYVDDDDDDDDVNDGGNGDYGGSIGAASPGGGGGGGGRAAKEEEKEEKEQQQHEMAVAVAGNREEQDTESSISLKKLNKSEIDQFLDRLHADSMDSTTTTAPSPFPTAAPAAVDVDDDVINVTE